MSEESELLFFDTFSHDSAEELNLDLVQFPRAVLVNEVRVIPLGTRVQADVPGGVRLGATNPSTFKLEFFSNNLSKRDASTFEKLGLLEYKSNVDIQFLPENKNPTDGLIIKGWYTTITLAVYGALTTVVARDKSPPPPPPPQPRAKAVGDAVSSSSAQPPAKPSSSLTPSDLPSLPSSKKVHKWLVDSTRPSGSHPSTHPHPPPAPHHPTPHWTQSEEQPPPSEDPALHANQVVTVPVSNLNQADLAREIFQVLGNVAAHTIEQSKLLSQSQQPAPVQQAGINVSAGHGQPYQTTPVPSYQYTEGQDTPASPGPGGPPVDYGTAFGPRGTVPIAVGEENLQTGLPQDFSRPPQAVPQPLGEVTPAPWAGPPQDFPPPEQQPIPIVGSVSQPPQGHHGDLVGTPEDEAMLLEIDPNYQSQASRSPRDIPLEQNTGTIDPRLDPRELPRDPRDRLPETKDATPDASKHRKDRGASRSRSRSRDRDYDRRSRERDYRDSRDYRDEHRDREYREHRERDRPSDSRDWQNWEQGRDSRDWERDRDRDRTERLSRESERDRDRDRGREPDRERDRNWGESEWDRREDRDRGRDDRDRERSRDQDKGSRDRDKDKSREFDRSRDQDRDRERPRDADRDRDRNRDIERSRDTDRERKDSDRDRSKREDDRERTKELETDRDRTRDPDRSRERDRDWADKQRKDKDGDKDRERPKEPIREVPREPAREALRDSREITRDAELHWEQKPKDNVVSREKPLQPPLVPPQLEEIRTSEPIPVIMSPVPARTRSPTPELNPQYQQVDMIGMSPEPPMGEIPPDTEMDNPDGVDIYGSLSVDNLNENLSDGEIQEAEGYSDISSDDNILTHLEEVEKIGDWGDYEIDDAWNFAISAFNPYQCYLGTLETFSDPSLTAYEVQKQKLVLARPKLEEQVMPSEALRILSIVAQYKSAQHFESWIEAAEEIPPLLANGLSYLVNKTDNKVLDTLLDWAFEGLDLTLAMAQPETAYKVRHLKMGIRLATALCSCDSYITFRMLSREVQQKLLDLFVSQYMSSSIKVQIVKGLDASTRLKDGMDWLLGKHHLQAHSHTSIDTPGSNENKTGYQRLLEIMLTKQVVRVTVALASLARKTHVYEILGKLNNTVKIIADSTPIPEAKPIGGTAGADDAEVPIEGMESDPPLPVENVTEDDAEIVVGCLNEASKVLRNVDNVLAQSKRGLPNELLFTKQEKCDSSSSMYHLLNSCHILESIFVLLSSPLTCNHNGIFHAVRGLLQQFLSVQTGLVFLSSRAEDVSNGIIRCLLQNPATAGGEYSQDEDRENHPAHQLGLSMIYSLQALQHIDQLKVYHARDGAQKDVDDAEALGALHALYTMTFVPQGREAIVFVLSLEDNMDIFMPFLEATMTEGLKDGRKKSVCYSYTVMFLLMMLRYSDQILWMQRLGPRIMDCCENADGGSSKMAEKLAEIQEMLLPIKKCPEADHNKVSELIALLKLYNEDILDLPKGIVTVLRLLKHLSTAPSQDPSCQEHVSELKYKYVILELFSSDSLPIFCNILQKVGDLVLRPWQQGLPQNSASKTLILSIVRPVLTIMKSVLCDLIQTRGSQFKDLSCLPCLLHLHTVLCSWSHTGTLTATLQQLQDDIVDIILCYTQPTVDGQDSDQALSQSLWTLTMKEIFKYVLMAPYTFLSGLILISELLPLPLPVQAKEALNPQEVETITNNRKLWSAHLHSLAGEIQEVIRSLSSSVCHPLQQVLRRVCWQLADLAVPSAVTVVRCLLDVLLENLDLSKEEKPPPPNEGAEQKDAALRDEVKSSSEMARVLNLLSFLMNQAPFKAAFLSMTRPGPKAETKYADILPRLLSVLNVVSESPSHTLAQENIVSVLQSLCDCDVSLVTAENVTLADQLPSSLPSQEQLNLICMGLMHHMSHPDQKFSSILPSLRTLAMLMDHDFGFYHVKCAMERVGTAFFNLFNQINITFSKDSSDCLATLSSAAECIQFLVTLPETSADAAELAPLERSYTMSLGEVRELLGWSDAHPLEDLNALLCEYAKEEETLRAVYESVNGVVTMLKSEEDDTQRQRPEVVEPQLSAPEPLANQFAMRTTFTLTDDEDDRLSATYWLATPMIDDQEIDLDLTTCDFDDMSLQYCPDFDLKIELEKGSLPSDITATKPRKRRRGNDTINTSRMRGSGGGFVAPMRGRGFGRGMNMNLNKNDAFRSRAPNTSRPPSMHVDDFVKFENSQSHSQNHSPSSQQQNTNLRIQRQDKDNNMGGRGRGFDRGRGGGRGFFQGNFPRSGGLQNNNYNNRRDQNQRGGFGFRGAIGGNRGGLAQRGTSSVRGSATSRGGSNINNRGSPIKSTSPWRTPRQQGYGSRGFGRGDSRAGSTDRMGSADRVDRRRDNLGGSSRFQRNGRQMGGSPWENKSKGERFMPPPGGFHRRDRGRHQRAFTK